MFRRHLLMNVWSLCVAALVVRQFSQAYSSTDFTLELKILIFVFVEVADSVQIGRKVLNTAVAFPILDLISWCVPFSLLTVLPKYVSWPTSSSSTPLMSIFSVYVLLILIVFVFGWFILKPTSPPCCSNIAVFSSISLCLWDRRAMSSARSRSSRCLRRVHWIPLACLDVVVDIT